MTRVDFTADDVARIRFCSAPPPLVESVLALEELRCALRRGEASPARAAADSGQAGGARRGWLDRMARTFPSSARPLLALVPRKPPMPFFLDPVTAGLDDGLEMIRAAPRDFVRADLAACWRAHARQGAAPSGWLRMLADGDREAREVVVRALRDFYLACVAPAWEGVCGLYRAEVAARLPVLAIGGHAKLLGELHPRLAWRDAGLERSWGEGRLALDGSGLWLVPSAFWTGPPMFAIRPPEVGGNALIYPAAARLTCAGSREGGPGEQGAPAAPGSPGQPGDDLMGMSGDVARPGGGQAGSRPGMAQGRLAAALGHTRASALRALHEPCGTVELAARLFVSPSTASEHVAALRSAGLASTMRHGRSVRHALTPLGRSLLGAVGGAGDMQVADGATAAG